MVDSSVRWIIIPLIAITVSACGASHTSYMPPPNPAKFCQGSGVKARYFAAGQESVACVNGNAFQWAAP